MKLSFLVLFLSVSWITKAQTTLEFSQSIIVSATQQTVPSGKTWKVTSIYGSDRICVPCIQNEHIASSSCNSRFVDYAGAAFLVNGNEVVSYRDWIGKSTFETTYADNTCTTAWDTHAISSFRWRMFDVPPNPNLLPMWLPEGTTLKAATANIYLSVIEFTVGP